MATTQTKATSFSVFVLLAAMTIMSPQVKGYLTCSQMVQRLSPCISYLRGGPFVPDCCGGVQSLYSAIRTTTDRQNACRCVKSTASNIKGINYANAASLPGKCGVSLSYKISPSTDCNRIS